MDPDFSDEVENLTFVSSSSWNYPVVVFAFISIFNVFSLLYSEINCVIYTIFVVQNFFFIIVEFFCQKQSLPTYFVSYMLYAICQQPKKLNTTILKNTSK